ncbi:MAG: hypothetical protein ACK482_10660 [Aphanizomenon sp.]|jgi:hypothetical protein
MSNSGEKMSENCRANCLQQRFAIALKEYTLELQAKRYIELYQQVRRSLPLEQASQLSI